MLDNYENSDDGYVNPSIKTSIQYYYDRIAVEALDLSKDEQTKVLCRFNSTDDETIRKECIDVICRANVKLVFKIAKNYAYDEDSLKEYISAGNEGLVTAVYKYKPGKAPFPNYAPAWIKQRILQELYTNTLLKVPLWRIKAFIKIKLYLKNFIAKNEELPSDEVVAAQTKISIKNVRELRHDVYLNKILDRATTDGEYPVLSVDDEIHRSTYESYYSTDPKFDEVGIQDAIYSGLSYLSVEHRFIVMAYHGLLDGNCKKLHQISPVVNVTPERVRQMKQDALNALHAYLVKSEVVDS